MSEYLKSIHHIGYLVKKMPQAIERFLQLGYKKESEIIYDPYRDIDICFLKHGGYCVELVCPKSKGSPIYPLLGKVGVSPYHICYEVNCLEVAATHLQKNGYLQINAPQTAPAFEGRAVAFYYNRHLGMIELVEG